MKIYEFKDYETDERAYFNDIEVCLEFVKQIKNRVLEYLKSEGIEEDDYIINEDYEINKIELNPNPNEWYDSI